jgi:hypothetical protein
MPEKLKAKSPPKEYKVIEFLSGEIQPIVVAGKNVEKIIDGYTSKTAANERSLKVGPRYFMRGSRPYYLVSDLVDHFTQNPVETLNHE